MTSYWTERANTLLELKWKKKEIKLSCSYMYVSHITLIHIIYLLQAHSSSCCIMNFSWSIMKFFDYYTSKIQRKREGSVFIPFLWVMAYLTWPFCTFDAVSVRFVFNICQYLQYYITLNIILIYCQWSDLNREVKKNNLACIKCIIFWVTFLNLKQTTSSTATIC